LMAFFSRLAEYNVGIEGGGASESEQSARRARK
jgi:hypothetical protein